MLMMGVGVMAMRMGKRRMRMPMAMLRPRRHRKIVGMLMVLVMHMFMIVLEGFVCVLMPMIFRQVQPDTQTHENSGRTQPQRKSFTHGERDKSAKKWCQGKIRPGAGAPQMP